MLRISIKVTDFEVNSMVNISRIFNHFMRNEEMALLNLFDNVCLEVDTRLSGLTKVPFCWNRIFKKDHIDK